MTFANEKELQLALSSWMSENGLKNRLECRDEKFVRPDIGVVDLDGNIEFLVEVKPNLSRQLEIPSSAANFLRQCHAYHAQYQKPVYLGPVFIDSLSSMSDQKYRYFLEFSGMFSIGLLFVVSANERWASIELKMAKCPRISVKPRINQQVNREFFVDDEVEQSKLNYLINCAGSVQGLANVLGCTRACVYKWKESSCEFLPQPWLDALKYRKPQWFSPE